MEPYSRPSFEFRPLGAIEREMNVEHVARPKHLGHAQDIPASYLSLRDLGQVYRRPLPSLRLVHERVMRLDSPDLRP